MPDAAPKPTPVRRAEPLGEPSFRQIAEGIAPIVWTTLADGYHDYFNARWYAYTGMERGEEQGWQWKEYLHPDDLGRTTEVWERCLATGEPYRIEYRFRRADGAYRWFLGEALPIRDDAGAIVRWFGTLTDIHEQKVSERTLALTNELGRVLGQELSPERVVQALTDASTRAVGAAFGSFFYATPSERENPDDPDRFGLYALSGADPEAFAGFPPVRSTPLFTPTFSGEGAVRVADVTRDFRFGGMPEGHLPVRSYLAVPVRGRDGNVLGGLLFGHPEAGRFTAEHERIVEAFAAQASVAYENAVLYGMLQTAKDELERRVAERTEELTRVNRDLNEFSYSVAHDLRAPLRAIVSTSRILLEDAADRLEAEERTALERQATNALRLAGIVDDLLQFARLAKAEPRKGPVDVTRLARAAAEDVARRWPGPPRVTVQDGMRAVGDASLLEYALTNLFDNAYKFSPEGGEIEMGEEGGAFYVRDRGVGFDMAHSHKLFVAFERLVDQETFAGTGVGLANVKRIVERHGGRVWAESVPGEGATFWFTLP